MEVECEKNRVNDKEKGNKRGMMSLISQSLVFFGPKENQLLLWTLQCNNPMLRFIQYCNNYVFHTTQAEYINEDKPHFSLIFLDYKFGPVWQSDRKRGR